jgi:hypothetical protein
MRGIFEFRVLRFCVLLGENDSEEDLGRDFVE